MRTTWFTRLAALVAVFGLLLTGTALADEVEGDFVDADGTSTSVTAGEPFSLDVDLYIVRSHQNHIVRTVAWSVATSGVCAGISGGDASPSTLTMPDGWEGMATGTRSIDHDRSSAATISGTGGAAGQSCTVTYTGTPTSNHSGQGIPPGQRNVSFTVSFEAPDEPVDPPEITANVDGTLGEDDWYTSDVTVTWDIEGGEPTAGCEPTTIDSDTAGETLTCEAEGPGGTASESVEIKRDATPPNAPTADVSPEANEAGWHNEEVTVTFTAAGDEGPSGVASCTDPQVVDEETPVEGTVVSGTCTDAAGNTSAATEVTVKLDMTDPGIALEDRTPANDNGWNNDDVTVVWACADALSGVVDDTATETVTTEGAGQTATGTCTDRAGNTASATETGINIDLTDPEVALVGGPDDGSEHYFGDVPDAPTCEASDALSGIDGACEIDGYETTVGVHTVTATATDRAGNVATDELTYEVLAWSTEGFHRPVRPDQVNTIQGGRTVPLRFNVYAGPSGENEQTDPAVVTSLSVVKSDCSGNGETNEVDAEATGNTELRYAGGEFIYNWKTPSGRNKCYTAVVTLVDGSQITAEFRTR